MKSIKPIYNNTLNKNTNTSFSVVDNFFGKQMLDWIISWQISLVLCLLFFWCISLEFQNQICCWAGIQSELSAQIICELVKKALLASSSYISILNSIFSNCGQLGIFSKSFPGYFQKALLAFSSASFKDSAIASRHQIFLTEKYKDNVYQ